MLIFEECYKKHSHQRFSFIDAMLNEKDTRIIESLLMLFNIVITKKKLNDSNKGYDTIVNITSAKNSHKSPDFYKI